MKRFWTDTLTLCESLTGCWCVSRSKQAFQTAPGRQLSTSPTKGGQGYVVIDADMPNADISDNYFRKTYLNLINIRSMPVLNFCFCSQGPSALLVVGEGPRFSLFCRGISLISGGINYH